MTGHELIRALANLSPEELNHPVLLEQFPEYTNSFRPCRVLVFDPELHEILCLSEGPFDNA